MFVQSIAITNLNVITNEKNASVSSGDNAYSVEWMG